MIKKIMAVLLVLMLAFAMVACGGESGRTLEQAFKIEDAVEFEIYRNAIIYGPVGNMDVDIVDNEIIFTVESPHLDMYAGDSDMIESLKSTYNPELAYEELGIKELIDEFEEKYDDIDGEIVATITYTTSTNDRLFDMTFNKYGIIE